MIITSREEFENKGIILAMTSIGGSPIHPGHTRLIRDCKKRVYHDHWLWRDPHQFYVESMVQKAIKLLVVVNCDDFLMRKHGFVFQNENDRAEIIDSIKDVDYTYIHHSDKQTIDDCIHYFQPHYFCKGGDRSSVANLPVSEVQACEDYGTKILFGVGGADKASSSSDLIKRAVEHYDYICKCEESLNLEI